MNDLTYQQRIDLYYKLIDKNFEKIQKIEDESSYFMSKINELIQLQMEKKNVK